MPAERRSLRSNNKSDTSSSANGEKTRSGSQSSNSNKDNKSAPTRAAANKAKSTKTASDAGMGEQRDQPHANGADSTKNGVNGSEDVEMGEDTAGGPTSSFNASKDRNGDQKMTVVVPPSKGSKAPGDKGQDRGDVSMKGTEGQESSSEIDPKTKAIQGWLCSCSDGHFRLIKYVLYFRYQDQLFTSRTRGRPFRSQVHAPRLEVYIVYAQADHFGRSC